MRILPGFIFSTAAMLMTGAAIVPAVPTQAAVSFNINFGFNYFHDRLADGGHWLYSPVWGDVWQPRRRLVGYDFQPYTNGYWQYTSEYGWYWVSEDQFDDVVYHYGRWVYDPDMSWVWIPGYTWSPGWVVWREGDGYSGWLPMPPDDEFVSGSGLSLGMNFGSSGVNFYGYNKWYGNRVDPDRFWVFVDNRNLANRDYRRFVVPRERARVLITNTRNVTKFEVVNNRVVNRSIDVKIVERASGHRIEPVPARNVMKRDAIVTTVDESNRIRQRERTEHPIRAGFVKGGAGGAMGGANGNRPGDGTGRPGGAMGAEQQNGAGEGGKRDRNNASGGAMTGGAEQPTGTAEGSKRERNNASGGAMTGGAVQPNGTAEGGKRDRNNASGGAMTGGGTEQPNGTAEGGKRDRNNASGAAGGNAQTGASGAATSGGPADNEKATHKPRSISNGSSDNSTANGENNGAPDRTNHKARSNDTMSGPAGGGQPSGASTNESSPSDAPKRNHTANPGGAMGTDNGMQNTTSPKENRTPHNNPGAAMTSPSDNTPPPEPKHRAATPAGNGMNGPGAAPPSGASNAQQPDTTKKKNPKHNPPGTPPDSGTPQ